MKTFPASYAAYKDQLTDSSPIWIYKFAAGGVTYYLSDNATNVAPWGIVTLKWVKSWGQILEGISGTLNEFRISDFTLDILVDPDASPNMETLVTTHELEASPCSLYLWFYGCPDAPRERWRGYVKDIDLPDQTLVKLSIQDETLRLERAMIGTKLTLQDYPYADLDDVGKVIPIPFGTVKSLPALAINAGAITSLPASISAVATSFGVTSALELYPSVVIQIDDELILVNSISGDTITSCVRGYNATEAAVHLKGASAWEQQSSFDYIFSDIPVASVSKVYAMMGGRKMDITSICTIYLGTVGNEHPLYPGKGIITMAGYVTVAQGVDLLVNDGISINDALAIVDTMVINDNIDLLNDTALTDTIAVLDDLGLTDAIAIASTLGVTDTIGVLSSIAPSDAIAVVSTLAIADSIDVLNTVSLSDTIGILNSLGLTDAIEIASTLGVTDTVGVLSSIAPVDSIAVLYTLGITDGITVSDTIAVSSAAHDHQQTLIFVPNLWTSSNSDAANAVDHNGDTYVTLTADNVAAKVFWVVPRALPALPGQMTRVRFSWVESHTGTFHFVNVTNSAITVTVVSGTWYTPADLDWSTFCSGTDDRRGLGFYQPVQAAGNYVRIYDVTMEVEYTPTIQTTVASVSRSGSASKAGTTTLTGTVSKDGTVTLTGDVTKTGSAVLSGAVDRTGAVSMGGDITKTGSAALSGDVTKTGAAALTGTVSKDGTVTLTGDVTKTGSAVLSGSVDRTGAVTLGGSVTKTGTVTLSGGVSKTGTVTKTGGVVRSGGVTRSGSVTLSGNSVANTLIGDQILCDVVALDTSIPAVYAWLLTAGSYPGAFQQVGTWPAFYAYNGIITKYRSALYWLNELAFQARAWFKISCGTAQLIYRPDTLTPVKTLATCRISGGKRVHRRKKTPYDEILNVVDVRYLRDWTKPKSADSYMAVEKCVPDAGSIADYGRRERPELFLFDFVTDPAMAADQKIFYQTWYAIRHWLHEFDTFLYDAELEFGDAITLGFAGGEVGQILETKDAPGSSIKSDTIGMVVVV